MKVYIQFAIHIQKQYNTLKLKLKATKNTMFSITAVT
jgi:hypothetical protein